MLVGVGIAIGLTYPMLTTEVAESPVAAPAEGENPPENVENTVPEIETPVTTDLQSSEPPPGNEISYDSQTPQQISDERRLEQADSFLSVGNFSSAFQNYSDLASDTVGQASSRLQLKMAISAEFSNQLADAEGLYLQLARSLGQDSVDRLAALSGLTRIWTRLDRDEEALELLHELYLTVGTNGNVPAEIRMQIVHQLATLNRKRLAGEFPLIHRDQRELEYIDLPPDLDTTITLPANFRVTDLKLEPGQLISVQLLQRPNEDAQLIALDTFSDFLPTLDALRELFKQAKLTLKMTERAQSTLQARSVKLSIREVSLALTLDSILIPLGVGWVQENDQIQLFYQQDDPDKAVEFQFKHALRLLRTIELTFPRNLRRSAGLMHQGNLNFVMRDFEAAASRYNELRQLNPGGELAAKLSYNRGKLAYAMKRPDESSRHFIRAVDQSEDYRLQAKSYAWLSRAEFIQSNFERSVNAATRSLHLANDPFLREDTVMLLAKCYLLDNNPYSANKVIFDFREDLRSDGAQRLAAMLGAFSRYLRMSPVEGLRNEGERLIVALVALKPEDYREFVDQLLVGRGFFEIGLKERSTELLQQAMESAERPYWRRRIAFELGLLRHRAGELDKATVAFEEVARDTSDQPGLLAKLRLAQIALANDKPKETLRHCEDIIDLKHKLSEEMRGKVLNAMGMAYRKLNLNHAAAVCFAGMYPDKDQFDVVDENVNQ